MNEALKNRIVGAIVITAIAAIFIPMLFDEPISNADNYTSNQLALPVQGGSQLQPLIASIPHSSEEVIAKTQLAQISLQQKTSTSPSVDTNLKSWVIQVGSFNSEKNASEFKDRLRQQKFTAYVSPVKGKFRLLVGPELGHKRALKTQQRLEAMFNTKKTLLISE